ncbi:hypothetical protein [Alicyclobacillus acidocaldarius]|uniref:Uncharacterized protein n=1 Tax=Alicyclobacillus acidocaldarius (strain Tc-4-1) TaxID=1048834 RepID=F8IJW0_ALIAT|nr:hypothetical protein [Alicyclobacillus acidocaldarius]AEJ43472.1 hypothetical protein TC41_1540 [Alicyclobacillus acidocaldarius subsp. acidocaldarius Tc-4-1]
MTEREEALPPWTNRTSLRDDVRRFVFEAYMDIALADMLDETSLVEPDVDNAVERD